MGVCKRSSTFCLARMRRSKADVLLCDTPDDIDKGNLIKLVAIGVGNFDLAFWFWHGGSEISVPPSWLSEGSMFSFTDDEHEQFVYSPIEVFPCGFIMCSHARGNE